MRLQQTQLRRRPAPHGDQPLAAPRWRGLRLAGARLSRGVGHQRRRRRRARFDPPVKLAGAAG
eukprot:9504538-Lingulodinium_polyedra.AAC.1